MRFFFFCGSCSDGPSVLPSSLPLIFTLLSEPDKDSLLTPSPTCCVAAVAAAFSSSWCCRRFWLFEDSAAAVDGGGVAATTSVGVTLVLSRLAGGASKTAAGPGSHGGSGGICCFCEGLLHATVLLVAGEGMTLRLLPFGSAAAPFSCSCWCTSSI